MRRAVRWLRRLWRKPADIPARRAVLIDAMNLAYWRGEPPSLIVPLTALSALLEAGYDAVLCFDASAPHRLAHEGEVYAQLRRYPQRMIEVKSGRRADGELLRRARSGGACIVSRDHFRDYRARYRKIIDDPARVLDGSARKGRLVLPALGIDTLLPQSAGEACAAFLSLCDDNSMSTGRS